MILDSKFYSMPKQKTLAPFCRSFHHPEVLKKIFQNKITRLTAKKMYRHVRDRSIAFFFFLEDNCFTIVLVFAIHQHESAIGIYMPPVTAEPPSHLPLHPIPLVITEHQI